MAFSTISDLTNSTSLDGLLKKYYLPGLTETVFNDPSFTALIQQLTPADITFQGQHVVHAFETQRSAGVGTITEGGSFVDSVPVKGKQGYENLKYLNAYIELSGPLIATANTQAGSFVNAVARHFQTNIISAKNDLERQLMGKADGVVATLTSGSATTGSTLTVDGDAFYDTQFVEPGMQIEFRAPSFTTPTLRESIATDTTDYDYVNVSSITKGDKRNSTNGTIIVTETLDSAVTALDWVMKKGAWVSTTSCKEINGLRNLISDGSNNSETTNNYLYVWPSSSSNGISRTSSTYTASYTNDFSSTPLDEDNLMEMLIMLQTQYQGNPNLLVVSPWSKKEYFTDVASGIRQFNTNRAMDWVGGYKGLGVQIGGKELMLTSLASCPTGYIYMINTNDFAFTTASNGYQWVLGDGNNVLQQSHTKDTKFASAVNYLQFVCFDPGKQAKGYGVSESA